MPQGLTDSKPCLQAFMLSESSLQVLGFNFYFPLHHKLISHLGQSCSRSEIFSRHAAPCKNKGPPDLLIHEEHPECCHQSHFCTLVLKMAQLSLNTMSHLSPAVRYLNRSWMAYPLPWIPAQPLSSHQLKAIINWYLYDLNTHKAIDCITPSLLPLAYSHNSAGGWAPSHSLWSSHRPWYPKVISERASSYFL